VVWRAVVQIPTVARRLVGAAGRRLARADLGPEDLVKTAPAGQPSRFSSRFAFNPVIVRHTIMMRCIAPRCREDVTP
jgi:hypothetical protein